MGQQQFSNSIITTKTEISLPAEISKFSAQHGLTVAETQDVQLLVTEHRTNLPTISGLLEEGLTVYEVAEVYDTRERVNTALESSIDSQQVSLKAIVGFQRRFPELTLDADCLVENLLELHDTVQGRYFSSAIAAVTEAATWHSECFAGVLAAFINGELQVEDPDNVY